jgi:hypothetical protein
MVRECAGRIVRVGIGGSQLPKNVPRGADRLPEGRPREVTDRTTQRITASVGPRAGLELVANVLTYGFLRVPHGEVAGLRRRPGPIPDGWAGVAPSLLRNSDEQTVVGTAAVFTAISRACLRRSELANWGVVAASRYLGRANLALALQSFMAEGVWGTSPHLIPHFALHSPAGTISIALGTHGPNLGVGGGLYAAAEGFLTALTWLANANLPGVWLVLSGWSPELVPGRCGSDKADGECQALALALVAEGVASSPLAFRAMMRTESHHKIAHFDMLHLAETLESQDEGLSRTLATDPTGRLRIELVNRSAGLE